MAESNKIISFAGVKRGDVVYYIAKLLATFDEPVLVVDNSDQHDTFRSVHHKGDIDEAYVRNITFVRDIAFSERMISAFNYVVVYHGMDIEPTWWNNSDDRFIVTNYDRFDIDDIRDAMAHVAPEPIGLIFTDKVSGKITERFIVEMLNLPEEVIEHAIEIPRDDAIEAAKLSLQHDRIYKVAKLPSTMKKALTDIFDRITPEDKKRKMDKLFAKAC